MTASRVDQDRVVGTEPAARPAAPPPVPDDGDRARPAGWALDHWKGLAVLAAVLAVVGVVHAVGMSGAPQRVDDEGT